MGCLRSEGSFSFPRIGDADQLSIRIGKHLAKRDNNDRPGRAGLLHFDNRPRVESAAEEIGYRL